MATRTEVRAMVINPVKPAQNTAATTGEINLLQTPEDKLKRLNEILTEIKRIGEEVKKIDKKAGESILNSISNLDDFGITISLKMPDVVKGLLIPFSAIFQFAKYQKLKDYYIRLNNLEVSYNSLSNLYWNQVNPEFLKEAQRLATSKRSDVKTILTGESGGEIEFPEPSGSGSGSGGGLQLTTNTPAPSTGSNTTLYIVAGLALVAIGGVIWYTSSNK